MKKKEEEKKRKEAEQKKKEQAMANEMAFIGREADFVTHSVSFSIFIGSLGLAYVEDVYGRMYITASGGVGGSLTRNPLEIAETKGYLIMVEIEDQMEQFGDKKPKEKALKEGLTGISGTLNWGALVKNETSYSPQNKALTHEIGMGKSPNIGVQVNYTESVDDMVQNMIFRGAVAITIVKMPYLRLGRKL